MDMKGWQKPFNILVSCVLCFSACYNLLTLIFTPFIWITTVQNVSHKTGSGLRDGAEGRLE